MLRLLVLAEARAAATAKARPSWRGGLPSTRVRASSSLRGAPNRDDEEDGPACQMRRRRRRLRPWLPATADAHRGFRLSPKYEGDRAHKHVSFREMARLVLSEKLTFGGAVAAIGLASASSLVIPHIFGSVVDILSAAAMASPDLAQAAAAVAGDGAMSSIPPSPPPPPPPPTATAAAAAAATEAAEEALSLGSIRDPTVLEALKANAWQMLGVSIVGTGATYVSTAQLDIVGQRISMDLRKRLFGRILDQDLAL